MDSKDQTLTFLEENIGEKLHDIGLGNSLLDMTQEKSQATKGKIDKWDYSELKTLCTKEQNQQSEKGESICRSYI